MMLRLLSPNRAELPDHALSSRNMSSGGDVRRLAGVLLGKTSLNSLYGLLGGLPQSVPQFAAANYATVSLS
jgi:hypothetical protein